MGLKSIKEIITNLDKENIKSGRETCIQKRDDGHLHKITISILDEVKEEGDMKDKFERWSINFKNICEGYLEFADEKEKVDKIELEINNLIDSIKLLISDSRRKEVKYG